MYAKSYKGLKNVLELFYISLYEFMKIYYMPLWICNGVYGIKVVLMRVRLADEGLLWFVNA